MNEATGNGGTRARWHFWLIGIVALLWNAIGAFDYVMTQTRNEAYMSQFTSEQLEYFYGFPAWAVAAWAIAVWGSVIACVLLLLRKSVAVWVFGIALIAMALTTLYNFVLSDGLEHMGGLFEMMFSLAIVVIAVGLLVYSRVMADRGVLR
jgi:hypothetical protein